MPSLPLPERVKLAKILSLLGSAHAGGRDNAALMATQIMQVHGATWPDVLLTAPLPTRSRPASPTPSGWRALAHQCAARLDELNAWQSNFINSVLGLKSPSPTQLEKLRENAIELGLEDPE